MSGGLLKLRDYQAATIAAIHTRWDAGDRRTVAVLPTGAGKGHPLDTEVPTPDGLRRWGDLKPGDRVFGSDGVPTEVTTVYDRGVLPTYRVTFSDGASVEVDGDHLWAVRDGERRRTLRERGVIDTRSLRGSNLRMTRGYRWHIPITSPVARRRADLPLDPYVVGALIANGGMTGAGTVLTTSDPDVAKWVNVATECNKINDATPGVCDRYSLPGLTGVTRALGMRVRSSEKRIPRLYLESSREQRTGLLHGLMDGDAAARDSFRRSVNYSTTSPGLAGDMVELVTSLGGTANLRTSVRLGRAPEYTVGILMPVDISPFGTVRKSGGTASVRNLKPRRAIVSIESVGEKPIRCITVAAENSLYLITRQHIVTHNTVVFSHLIKDTLDAWRAAGDGGRVLVLVHTEELADQAAKKLHDVAPHLRIGIVKAARNQVTADVIIGSVQTLRNARRLAQLRRVRRIVTDECFPAGTMVGDQPIESLRVGDVVPSYDEETGEAVSAPVVAVMKSVPSGLVRVTLDDGQTVVCTPGHPFMTRDGWLPAVLSRGESVLSFTHDATAGEVHGMRDRTGPSDSTEVQTGRVQEVGSGVLSGAVSGRMGVARPFGADGADESGARFGAHEAQQPDGTTGVPSEDVRDAAGDRTQASIAGWQRASDPWAAGETGRASGMADRSHGGARGRGSSVSLQAGHRAPVDEGVRRGGRRISLLAGAPRIGPSSGRAARWSRVVDVQVLESGRDGTYGGLCPDGFVYNVEVAGTHTYRVGDGVVVHNCHHGTAATYRKIYAWFGALPHDTYPVGPEYRDTVCEECSDAIDSVEADTGKRLEPSRGSCPNSGCPYGKSNAADMVGFTATLARGDNQKLSEIWESVAYRKDIGFMIRRGYLRDVRGKRVEVADLDLAKVKKSGGDYRASDLGDALEASLAPEIVAKAVLEHAAGRSVVAFWPTVSAAQAYVDAANDLGLKTEIMHGALAPGERRDVLTRLHNGDTPQVANCMVLTEGFDEPRVSCVVIARPTRSAPLYQQMVGRALRLWCPVHEGRARIKPEPCCEESITVALVLDVVGASRAHDLASLVDLSEKDLKEIPDDMTLTEWEDEEEEGDGDAPVKLIHTGPVETVEFDPLQRDSKSVWNRTPEGIWFLTVGGNDGRYVFLLPSTYVDPETGEPAPPDAWDVVWASKSAYGAHRAMGATEHRGVSEEAAFAWAEDIADDWRMNGWEVPDGAGGPPIRIQVALNTTSKRAAWRRKPASARQLAELKRRKVDLPEAVRTWERAQSESVEMKDSEGWTWKVETSCPMSAGEASDMIDRHAAGQRIDPIAAWAASYRS